MRLANVVTARGRDTPIPQRESQPNVRALEVGNAEAS
jgi:hypothetical protein